MTLPGTWTDALASTAAIVEVLMPTLASASAGSSTSTSPAGSAGDGAAAGADDIPGIAVPPWGGGAFCGAGFAEPPAFRRSPQTPAATPRATRPMASSPPASARTTRLRPERVRGRSLTCPSSRFIVCPRSAGGPGRPLDLDRRVVDLLQRVGVPHLDVDVSPLLGDHVEQGPATQLVRLAHHIQVLACHVAHAARVDLERPLRGLVLGERGLDLLAYGEHGQLDAALRRRRLGPRRRDVPLILVPHRQRDRERASEVVEYVLNGSRPAPIGEPTQARKAKVLALIVDREAGIPSALGLLLRDL